MQLTFDITVFAGQNRPPCVLAGRHAR